MDISKYTYFNTKKKVHLFVFDGEINCQKCDKTLKNALYVITQWIKRNKKVENKRKRFYEIKQSVSCELCLPKFNGGLAEVTENNIYLRVPYLNVEEIENYIQILVSPVPDLQVATGKNGLITVFDVNEIKGNIIDKTVLSGREHSEKIDNKSLLQLEQRDEELGDGLLIVDKLRKKEKIDTGMGANDFFNLLKESIPLLPNQEPHLALEDKK